MKRPAYTPLATGALLFFLLPSVSFSATHSGVSCSAIQKYEQCIKQVEESRRCAWCGAKDPTYDGEGECYDADAGLTCCTPNTPKVGPHCEPTVSLCNRSQVCTRYQSESTYGVCNMSMCCAASTPDVCETICYNSKTSNCCDSAGGTTCDKPDTCCTYVLGATCCAPDASCCMSVDGYSVWCCPTGTLCNPGCYPDGCCTNTTIGASVILPV